MVGSALVRRLASENCEILVSDRAFTDLRRQQAVEDWMRTHRPDAVFVAAARVGGIIANSTAPADFLFDNLVIGTNIIEAARRSGVHKLMYLGSSCIYPKLTPQPIPEEALLSGRLEGTHEAYAIAKIACLKLAAAYRQQLGCDYISAMPTNLYGPGDNFDPVSSHVLPALIRKAHEAKLQQATSITIWGSGTPRREFLHADDCADALVFLMKQYSDAEHVNVGAGYDLSIIELARMVADIVGFKGEILTDRSKPDGTPQKLMNSGKLNARGWHPRVPLNEGIAQTYQWFLENQCHVRGNAP
jgi:GDP-L-fucose synthase